jgi:glucose/mannose-6-phosphate isomerase
MKISDLEKIDSRFMFKIYDKWPQISKESYEKKFEKLDVTDIDHIVFAGMGGSGSIGDTIKAILSKEDIHVSTVKGYSLPKTVDSKTLVIATSVSGNTSETVEILKNVTKTEAKVAGFSSGGLVEKFCKDNNIFFQNIPMIHSPRASYASFLFSILNILEYILPIKQVDVTDTINTLEKTRKNIFSENLTDQNMALDLAKFTDNIIFICYPAGLQAGAIRYKNSLQENSKIHAMIEDVIESSHNGIVSWEKKSTVKPVLIQGQDDHMKTTERFNILKEFFELNHINYKIVNSIEGNILSKITNLVYLLDYSTIYASVLSNTDPSPVNSIDFIKKKL